jgi:hypothetical protein
MLLDSSQCWRKRSPLARELVQGTLQHIATNDPATRADPENDVVVNSQGEVDNYVDPTAAIAQLRDPDETGTVFLTGIRLPIVADLGFRCPRQLCGLAERGFPPSVRVPGCSSLCLLDMYLRLAVHQSDFARLRGMEGGTSKWCTTSCRHFLPRVFNQWVLANQSPVAPIVPQSSPVVPSRPQLSYDKPHGVSFQAP